MFWNFIQEPMVGPRMSPSDDQIFVGQKAFLEILDTYKPDRIIVWGRRLYGYLPDKGSPGEEIKLQSPWKDGKIYSEETWIYPLPDGAECKVMSLDHPSSGFAWDYWHEMISEFLK